MTTMFPDDAALVAHLRLLLLEPDDAVARMAARSYQHVNHFLKIPLVRTAEHVVRLHLWAAPPSAAHSEQNPHSHGWAFRSRIVRGSFAHTLFSEEETEASEEQQQDASEETKQEGAEVYRRYTLDLVHSDGTSKLSDSGATQLRRHAPTLLCAGDTYEVTRQDIHTLAPTAAGGITLVQTETDHDNTARVYSRGVVETAQVRPTLSADALRSHLESVVALLSPRT